MMTPQFILKASLCREPHCASGENWKRYAESEIENLGYASDYAEPGYQLTRKGQKERGILFANWNYFPSGIGDILERAGYSIEWSDEWTTCEQCGKAVRTSGDSYEWQQYYRLLNDCEVVCLDCLDWSEYLPTIEDNPSTAVPRRCNPAEHGYVLISKPGQYENGLHPGMDDDPRKILANLHEQGKYGIVFRIPEVSQFYLTFEVWQRQPETEE